MPARTLFRLERKRFALLFGLEGGRTNARGLWLLLGVYLGALFVAAVLAPPIYWGVQALAGAFPDVGTLEYLAGKAFHDYYDRVRWLPLLVALPLLLKVCGLTGPGALGFSLRRGELLAWAAALLAGYLLFRFATLVQGWGTDVVRKGDALERSVTMALLSAIPGAILVGLLEELVFRGLVLRIFLSALRGPWLAVVLSAVFFGLVHFKFPDAYWEGTGRVVEWHSGFYVGLWTLLGPLAEWNLAADRLHFGISLINYALLGVLLGVLFLRTGSLNRCAGFHSGLVLAMLAYGALYHVDAGGWVWFYGSTPIRGGLLATLLLGGCLLVVLVAFRQRHGAGETPLGHAADDAGAGTKREAGH